MSGPAPRRGREGRLTPEWAWWCRSGRVPSTEKTSGQCSTSEGSMAGARDDCRTVDHRGLPASEGFNDEDGLDNWTGIHRGGFGVRQRREPGWNDANSSTHHGGTDHDRCSHHRCAGTDHDRGADDDRRTRHHDYIELHGSATYLLVDLDFRVDLGHVPRDRA